jgi:hypothetical protein
MSSNVTDNRIRITCQVLSGITGEFREVVARVQATSEQDAVDKLFAIGRDENLYRFMGESGVIVPGDRPVPAPITTKYAEGEWWARA